METKETALEAIEGHHCHHRGAREAAVTECTSGHSQTSEVYRIADCGNACQLMVLFADIQHIVGTTGFDGFAHTCVVSLARIGASNVDNQLDNVSVNSAFTKSMNKVSDLL